MAVETKGFEWNTKKCHSIQEWHFLLMEIFTFYPGTNQKYLLLNLYAWLPVE
jgi:hypothetical protein